MEPMPDRRPLLVLCALVMLLASPRPVRAAVITEAGPCKVVVTGLAGVGLAAADEGVPSTLTEALVTEVSAVSRCDVVSKAEISSMLEYEADRALCTDGTVSCLAEVADAYGADTVIAGSVGRLGADYVLSARRMNVKTGVVERRAEQVVSGAPERLRVAAKNLGRALYDQPPLAADTPAAPASAASSPMPWLLVGGATVAGVGVVIVGAGTATALFADSRMAEPTATDKDDARLLGLVGIGGTVLGGVVVAAGGLLAALAMIE